MRVLIDTHVVIWAYERNLQLSAMATATLGSGLHSIFVSTASLWEIAIKLSSGKLKLLDPFPDFVQLAVLDQGFAILPVEPIHMAAVAAMPFPTKHRDPFDRMLVAQVQTDGYRLLSADTQLDAYGITRLW